MCKSEYKLLDIYDTAGMDGSTMNWTFGLSGSFGLMVMRLWWMGMEMIPIPLHQATKFLTFAFPFLQTAVVF